MTTTHMPRVWTPDEVAEYLKVSKAIVLEEIEKGNLLSFRVGSEWRCLETDVMTYVSKSKVGAHDIELTKAAEGQRTGDFSKISSFSFRWPKTGGGYVEEHFDEGYETTRQIDGHTFTFRIGFGNREAAGQLRKRVIVWLGNRPLVEFAGGNGYDIDDLLASVIKLPGGSQVFLEKDLPDEYKEFNIDKYNSIVRGPYASGNLAIVVHKNDLESMLRHAIIRAKYKELI
jgi:excisionase family DNA binding protein